MFFSNSLLLPAQTLKCCSSVVEKNMDVFSQRPVQELVPVVTTKPLSSREMNLAKRRARAAFSKQKSRDCSDEGPSAPPTPPIEPEKKKIKLDPPEEFVCECPKCAFLLQAHI